LTALTEPLDVETPILSDDVVFSASVQPLNLPAGVYGFSIPGTPEGTEAHKLQASGLQLPALGIGPAPSPQAALIQQFTSPGTIDRWLTQSGDRITVRIKGESAIMLLNSIRPPDQKALSIEIKRLDKPLPLQEGDAMQVMLHIQRVGDLYFKGGTIAPIQTGLAIEALVIDSQDEQSNCVVEYRARTADSFETPWLTDSMLCGSRGRGVPLLGFAVRPRYTAAERFDFQYRGYFRNSGWTELFSSGDWCQSPEFNDPLEGIELLRTERA
jgi:hypothetical protein